MIQKIHIDPPQMLEEPLFEKFTENIIRLDEWCEKNKIAFLLKNNPAEYARIYGNK